MSLGASKMPLTVQTNRAGQKTQAPSLLYQNPPTFLFKISQFRLLICDCFAFALFALPNLSIRHTTTQLVYDCL